MSAYLCDDCHLTALACYAVKHRCLAPNVPSGATEQDILELLHSANVKSLAARYPNDKGVPADPVLCQHARARTFPAIEIIKAAHCFNYQACEVKDYERSTAYQIMMRVIGEATSQMPGYEQAAWGIDCRGHR